jgi:hypothetical protein
VRPPELDEATRLARKLGDPELARILERIDLPAHHEQQTERQRQAEAAARAREQLEDIRKRAGRVLAGKEGDAAQSVAERWARESGVTVESLPQANAAALGRLHALLLRLPRRRP